MTASLSNKRAASVVMVAVTQLCFVTIMTTRLCQSSNYNCDYDYEGDSASFLPPPEAKHAAATQSVVDNATCIPPRHGDSQNHKIRTIYLQSRNLHDETYYSFINHICSCEDKDPYWAMPRGTLPHFYVGPLRHISAGFESILREYNDTTSCGPIFFGKPLWKEPDLTIVTTSYGGDFKPESDRYQQYVPLLNDPHYIFICHEDAPFLEGGIAANVFFLTPHHKRYIVPSFFPPAVVQRLTSESMRRRQRQGDGQVPIFLVLGAFQPRRRDTGGLTSALRAHRRRRFTVRFLNKHMTEDERRRRFPDPADFAKTESMVQTDSDEFMRRVAEADVVLPLVDREQFHQYHAYQEGKKLTSSVSWGLGFRKKMILYRPLAEVFGIEEDNATFFLHGESTGGVSAFGEAFGRVLDYCESSPM